MSAVPSTSARSASDRSRLFEPPSDSESDGGNGSSNAPRRRAGKEPARDMDEDDYGNTDVKMEPASNIAADNGQIYVDSDDDSDSDDPVIKTLPVFLTPALAESLALIQYPHRPPAPHTVHPLLPPSLRPEDPEHDERPAGWKVSARYKPKVGQLELSVPLEVQAGMEEHRFNMERARALGRGVSKNDLGPLGSGTNVSASTTHANNNMMDDRGFSRGNEEPLKRMTLVGETLPDQTWYACAVLKDSRSPAVLSWLLHIPNQWLIADEVHLTPLTRTMQMRASLNYLDEIDHLERSNARKERANNRIDGSDDENMSPGQGGDSDLDESAKSASAIAARKQKRAAAADKKAKADDMKAINVSVAEGSLAAASSGTGSGGPKDAKTARAAASLFGPAKAAQDEAWVDLPFYDPTVSLIESYDNM